MPAPQIHQLIVGVAQLEANGLQRHAAAGRIVQDVASVLLVEDVAVARRRVHASQDAAVTRRA